MGNQAAEAALADDKLSREHQVLLAEVYVPAFAQKCAALGYPIGDEASLHEMLETAALVKMALSGKDQSVVKQANASLKAVLGLDRAEAREARTEATVKTASALGSNPRVRAAVAFLMAGQK